MQLQLLPVETEQVLVVRLVELAEDFEVAEQIFEFQPLVSLLVDVVGDLVNKSWVLVEVLCLGKNGDYGGVNLIHGDLLLQVQLNDGFLENPVFNPEKLFVLKQRKLKCFQVLIYQDCLHF